MPSSSECFLTWEGGIGVQLAHALLQQAEAEGQCRRVVEQVEHYTVPRRFVSQDLLTLQLHHFLHKI